MLAREEHWRAGFRLHLCFAYLPSRVGHHQDCYQRLAGAAFACVIWRTIVLFCHTIVGVSSTTVPIRTLLHMQAYALEPKAKRASPTHTNTPSHTCAPRPWSRERYTRTQTLSHIHTHPCHGQESVTHAHACAHRNPHKHMRASTHLIVRHVPTPCLTRESTSIHNMNTRGRELNTPRQAAWPRRSRKP